MRPTIVITGGGTGGHFYPLLGFVHFYKAHRPETDFFYIGSIYGMEKDWVNRLFFGYLLLPIQGLQRRFSLQGFLHNLKIPFQLLSSLYQTWSALREMPISLVVSTGGYSAFLPLLYARIKGIPYILIEGNAVPGLVNRLFARKACSIFSYFGQSNYPEKQLLVPFLVKYAHFSQPGKETEPFPSLPSRTEFPWRFLITGGSLGAQGMNHIAKALIPRFPTVFWIWQTGKRYYHQYAETQYKNALILPYIDAMDQVYNEVDVVICRAGASTLVELLFYHKPAILIPSPHVVNRHQHENAHAFASIGGSQWFEETDQEGIIGCVETLIQNPDKLQQMRKNLERVASQFDESYEKETLRIVEQCQRNGGI